MLCVQLLQTLGNLHNNNDGSDLNYHMYPLTFKNMQTIILIIRSCIYFLLSLCLSCQNAHSILMRVLSIFMQHLRVNLRPNSTLRICIHIEVVNTISKRLHFMHLLLLVSHTENILYSKIRAANGMVNPQSCIQHTYTTSPCL